MLANLVNSSCKLVLLEAMLPKLKAQGHRVLIVRPSFFSHVFPDSDVNLSQFSQFKIALDIVEDFLNSLNYKFLRLDGDTSQMDRTRDIDAFNSEDSPYFIYLLSTRAGGVGINLTSASTVVIFDQDFNPFVDAQAIARAHRIGQKKTVRVYKLMCRGTCEERIMAIGNKKLGEDQVDFHFIQTSTDSWVESRFGSSHHSTNRRGTRGGGRYCVNLVVWSEGDF